MSRRQRPINLTDEEIHARIMENINFLKTDFFIGIYYLMCILGCVFLFARGMWFWVHEFWGEWVELAFILLSIPIALFRAGIYLSIFALFVPLLIGGCVTEYTALKAQQKMFAEMKRGKEYDEHCGGLAPVYGVIAGVLSLIMLIVFAEGLGQIPGVGYWVIRLTPMNLEGL